MLTKQTKVKKNSRLHKFVFFLLALSTCLTRVSICSFGWQRNTEEETIEKLFLSL